MSDIFIEETNSMIAFAFSVDEWVYDFGFRNHTEVYSTGDIL
jgi:hypothetical protein